MRLKEIREAKGLTQIELARRANLTQPFISELENGVKSNPSYQALQKLATALGISVSELLGETQPKAAGE
ncbi:MAG: helix-turn-helix transcriptional regulator [Pelotomaculum sp.]|nr:helix-turn-helix transcriptional regulator [Pelotomaculum sp.]